MIRHQERMAKGANDLHRVVLDQIAQIIRTHPMRRHAAVVLGHALNRQGQVVVARAFAVARTCQRVLARMMRPALRVQTRRQDADGLSLEHGKRQLAKIQHDVMDIAFGIGARHAVIADHGGRHRRLVRIQIDVRVRRRPRRYGRTRQRE
ncbi:hypothetical protein D3C73_1065550 [compost metagenome]